MGNSISTGSFSSSPPTARLEPLGAHVYLPGSGATDALCFQPIDEYSILQIWREGRSESRVKLVPADGEEVFLGAGCGVGVTLRVSTSVGTLGS